MDRGDGPKKFLEYDFRESVRNQREHEIGC